MIGTLDIVFQQMRRAVNQNIVVADFENILYTHDYFAELLLVIVYGYVLVESPIFSPSLIFIIVIIVRQVDKSIYPYGVQRIIG